MKAGSIVRYKGEWGNCHNQKYEISFVFPPVFGRVYYDLTAIDWNILSGSYEKLYSVAEDEIEFWVNN